MSAQFYSSIAPHYQKIFPFNPVQVDFLRRVLPYNGARVLDVGCATGELAFALTHFGFPTWAFDYDSEMIALAGKSKPEDAMFPVFETLDMRLITERFPEAFFDSVICFGNTLVHLLTTGEVQEFLQSAYQILAPEGKIAIQILNYDYILDQRIESLPLIENEHLRFERSYVFDSGPTITFNTKLTLKPDGEPIRNSVKLNPIRKNELRELMETSGFKNLDFFGSFKAEPLLENSLPLIVIGQK